MMSPHVNTIVSGAHALEAPFIPVSSAVLTPADLASVQEALANGWISSSGPHVARFEAAWAAYCGMPHGVAVSSGTAALEVAIASLDIGPGDEVILPTFTIISCVLAVLVSGATPVLVDCDAETWCMDAAQVEAAVTARTRAIMPVHMYGHPVEMDPLLRLRDRHQLAIVEDAAEAHGAGYWSAHTPARPGWQRCGGIGDLSAFSFYANKPITTGEGGMLLCRDAQVARRARAYRDLCFTPERRFYHTALGRNYRLANTQAALGLSQVSRMSAIVEHKRWLARSYTERLADLPDLQLPVERAWARSISWMYALVIRDERRLDREIFRSRLRARGVDTRPFFWCMHEQPALLDRGLFAGERYPQSERIARQGLYLPSGLDLTEADVDRVCDAVRAALSEP